MRIPIAVFATLVAASLARPVAAAPCVGFVDVDSASPFCPSVEWLKNRAITTGCSSTTLYCPSESVSRLAMAAFMTRLGAALSPLALQSSAVPGPIDLDSNAVVCGTQAFLAIGYPRRAVVDVNLSALASLPIDVAVTVVRSTDGGPWTPMGPESRGLVSGQWGNVSHIAYADIDVGQTVTFGMRLNRVAPGSADLLDSRCSVRMVAYGRTGDTSPY